MKLVRPFLLLLGITVLLKTTAAEAEQQSKEGSEGCSEKGQGESCTRSDEPKSRKKRLVTLPNASSLVMQSRLIVPQVPVGLYMIWVRCRFFIRPMFTESLNSA